MKPSKVSETFRIPCFMFDQTERLRPAAALDIAQEFACLGSKQLGVSDLELLDQGIVWVLARMLVRYEKLPVREDSINVETWHKGANGLFFIRDFRFKTPDGATAITATSSWVLMNLNTRRLARLESTQISPEPQSDDVAIEQQAQKVVLPAGTQLEEVGEHKVIFSDLDYNGHANNVKYTVWAMDTLPEEVVKSTIKEIEINFNKEAMPGETIRFYHAFVNGCHYIEGRVDDHQVFIERLIFE